jgi:hypothetical protein
VAENIFAIDAKFWMRVANRNDSASSKADKDKLSAMAEAVMVRAPGAAPCAQGPLAPAWHAGSHAPCPTPPGDDAWR